MARCLPCRTKHDRCSHQLGKRILVIPDTQVKPGVPTDHLKHVGRYIAAKRPDYVVMIGDWWDMPSLSSYDKGKKSAEGRRAVKDIETGNAAMSLLTSQYRGIAGYHPQEHFFLGNHEERIERHVEAFPELEGIFGYDLLNLEGWTVHPFLKIALIEGIEFCHYIPSEGNRRYALSSARSILNSRHCSVVVGHNQYTDMAIHKATKHTVIMAGTCYQHDESYIPNNDYRRQIVMLNEVRDGVFDPMFVSLDFLRARYAA